MKNRIYSQREKVLMLGVVLSLVVGGYLVIRYKPAIFQRAIITEQITALEESVSSATIPRAVSTSADATLKKTKEKERELGIMKEKLAILEEHLVNEKSQGEREELVLEISDLARSSEVLIFESKPFYVAQSLYGGNTSTEDFFEQLVGGKLYSRPILQMRIEGSFTAIQKFMSGLSDLSKQAVVMRFSLEVNQGAAQYTAQQLSSSILVAL